MAMGLTGNFAGVCGLGFRALGFRGLGFSV